MVRIFKIEYSINITIIIVLTYIINYDNNQKSAY
jgi:hypothetical protein